MTDDITPSEKQHWCFRRETTKLLSLSIAQIHMSLTEGDNSVNTLTESFQEMAEISTQVNYMAQQGQDEPKQPTAIADVAGSMSHHISQAIVAFQFYDRLCQRLEHVALSLDELSELLADEHNLNEPEGWHALRNNIRSKYTMEEERVLYDNIMRGVSSEDAMKMYRQAMAEAKKQAQDKDDIELF